MKFRKRPVVIDAEKFDGTEESIVRIMALPRKDSALAIRSEQGAIFIPTLEGLMRGDPGDWIICGVKGELYPCKPEIFDATYERAE
jgi:hypothetical protein